MTSELATAPSVIARRGSQYWVVGDHVTSKLTTEQTGGAFALAEVVVPPRRRSAAARARTGGRACSTSWRVTSSSCSATRRSAAGRAPWRSCRAVPHAFRNVGDAAGRFIVAATPAGFDRFVPEAGCPCDDAPPPRPCRRPGRRRAPHGGVGPARPGDPPGAPADPPGPGVRRRPAALGARPARERASHGRRVEWHVQRRRRHGRPRRGVPPHLHNTEDEVFYVVEGRSSSRSTARRRPRRRGRPCTCPRA